MGLPSSLSDRVQLPHEISCNLQTAKNTELYNAVPQSACVEHSTALCCWGWMKSSVKELASILVSLHRRFFFSLTLLYSLPQFLYISTEQLRPYLNCSFYSGRGKEPRSFLLLLSYCFVGREWFHFVLDLSESPFLYDFYIKSYPQEKMASYFVETKAPHIVPETQFDHKLLLFIILGIVLSHGIGG